MDDRQSPTLEDLANLLDAPESPGELGETKFFALWLLRQIPEIKKFWERMHEDPGDRPTMMELAQLYFSALSEGEYPESEGTAR